MEHYNSFNCGQVCKFDNIGRTYKDICSKMKTQISDCFNCPNRNCLLAFYNYVQIFLILEKILFDKFWYEKGLNEIVWIEKYAAGFRDLVNMGVNDIAIIKYILYEYPEMIPELVKIGRLRKEEIKNIKRGRLLDSLNTEQDHCSLNNKI